MANLIGSGINQIPTNGMLGNLAFQDKSYVSVDAVGIGTTFVDSGTAGQPLQVSGGAYVSGNVGIGTTTPTSKLTVQGNVLVSGVLTASNLVGTALSISGISTIANFLMTPVGTGATVGGIGVTYYGDGSNLTGTIPNTIQNTEINKIYYPLMTDVTSGTISSITVSSNSIVFNPGTDSLGIGTTNPGATLNVVPTSSSIAGLFSGTTSRDMVRITQLGTGNALVVEDSTNPDATPFIVKGDGSVGIGTTNPVATLQVKDALAFETTNTTTTSTSQVAVDTFAIATFRSAKYQVQMTCPGQIATLGGITTGGRGYTAGTFNVTFSNSSGTGADAQGTLTISNGTVNSLSIISGGSGYTTNDVLTAGGGSGLQVSVGSTASPSGAILTLGSITSAGIGYTAGVGVGTTTLSFLGGTGTGAVGLATIFNGVITSSTLLQQPTTGTGGTVYYSGSNYTTSTVLTIAKTDVTNTITTIAGSVGVSTFTSLTAHGIGVSDVIRVSSTSNGLTAGTDYYVVTVPTTTTFTLGSSVGIGTTFTTGSSLSIGFYRNSAIAGGNVAYLNAITGVSTNYQVSDLLVLQNGTNADYVEYAGIANNDILGTFAADISGANARLLLTPTYATNNVKVARQGMTI